MNIKCEVIKDLLPLYVDGVVSDESRELIEEHLKTCPDCSEYCRLLQEETPEVSVAEFADETVPLKKIKRRITRNQLLIAMIIIGFAIIAFATFNALNINEYEGSLEENVSYKIPAGYKEVPMSSTDENNKQYIRETDEYRETLTVSYSGLEYGDSLSPKYAVDLDDMTKYELSTWDFTDNDNSMHTVVRHGDEATNDAYGEVYYIDYKCRIKSKENYYSSCSKQQQDEMLKFVKTFEFHRPEKGAAESGFKLDAGNAGGLVILGLVILVFIGFPIAIGISSIVHGSGDDKETEPPVTSKDMLESVNRERKAKGESTLPAINTVSGVSSNNLARRDHSWSSLPDFFIKLFRK